MLKEHNFEKANFRSLLEEDNIGHLDERLNIIDTFLGTERHLTLEELMDLLKDRGHDYDVDFVRQCMKRWVAYGFAQKKTFDGRPPLYEHRHVGRHHDHLICTKCGDLTEFQNDEMEKLQAEIALRHGFHVLQHKMEIYGLCRKCLEQRRPQMPLSLAGAGERVTVTDVRAGKLARSKLNGLGLRVGDHIEIISNDGRGRLVVGRGSTRLAIGRGLATKILVGVEDPGLNLQEPEKSVLQSV